MGNARRFYQMNVLFKHSSKKDKRFKAEYPNKTVQFGSANGMTFIDHTDVKKKTNWEKRHIVREDWNNYESAGALSKHILWNKTTLRDSLRDLNRRQERFVFIATIQTANPEDLWTSVCYKVFLYSIDHTYVVSVFNIFLRPFNWNTLILLCWDGVSCADSIPYRSFALMTASSTLILKATFTSQCLQITSSLLKMVMQVDIRLLSSGVTFEYRLMWHPRYVTSGFRFTLVPSADLMYAFTLVVNTSHLFWFNFKPYFAPSCSMSF